MTYYEKPFPSASLDHWLTTEPEDRYETPSCGDYYANGRCSYCEQRKLVCAACNLCFSCEEQANHPDAEADDPCNDD